MRGQFRLLPLLLLVTSCIDSPSDIEISELNGQYFAEGCHPFSIRNGILAASGKSLPIRLVKIKGANYVNYVGIAVSDQPCAVVSTDMPNLLPILRSDDNVSISLLTVDQQYEVTFTRAPFRK